MKINDFTKVLFVTASAVSFYAPASTAAATLAEAETNDSLSIAQGLGYDRSHTVAGVMGTLGATNHTDLDFYTFEANAGDTITLDIDNGYGGGGNIDTILSIFDASGKLLDMNDNPKTLDEGSTSLADARIDAYKIPSTGTYTVGVSTYPRYFTHGGVVMDASTGGRTVRLNPAGDYVLVIGGITPRVKQISFEVKPGSMQMAPLNPSAKGKIPVAIFGAADFDVSTIDQNSLTFGSTGDEASLANCQRVSRDINKDGYGDLLCHFNNEAAGFVSGDIEVQMKGQTKAKQAFEGHALLKVVPSQRK